MSDVLRKSLRLLLADGVGTKTFAALVRAFGSVEAAAEAGPGRWRMVKGVGPKTVAALCDVSEATIDEELAEAQRLGVRILTLDCEDYPQALKETADPPPLLYVRGRIESEDALSVGVVGSRRATHYGLEQAGRFGGLLGRAGLTVISGGARGIDTAAHRGALTAGGRTLAVMGCGLSHTYPPENEELFAQILDAGGALLSELPMRTAVLAGNFPNRNRIISGLSLGTLVIEAGLPSGALITARTAAEQGREVFAVPGRVDSPVSAGTHQLLRDGATLAADLDDILNALGDVGTALSDEPKVAQQAVVPASLDATEQAIFNALGTETLAMDDIARKTKLPTPKIVAAMTMLTLKGVVVQQPGSVFQRKR
jgi:DNA processing protein